VRRTPKINPARQEKDKKAPIAKVTPPAISGYLPRRRLFRLLDTARKRPLVWLSAPAGSGKTTLIGSYIDVRRLPCLWYQVDEGDADAATFFYYMGLAARRAAPRKRKPLPLLTPEYLPNLPAFTQRYFEELYGRLAPGSVLVFDNCQKLRPDSAMLEVIRNALSYIPAGVNAILISRSDPAPVFARMRAHRLMEVIGWKDLRLTPDETGGIIRQRWKGRTRRDFVGYLQARTAGWAAGVVLLLEKYGAEGIDPRAPDRHPPEEIFDYFAGEIFDKADPELRAFLLASAFLPQMTAGMAERLTGQARAQQILSYLNRNNYFTLKYPHGEPVYAYHALFREFLISRAKSSHSEEETARIQRTAAVILAEHGHAEDAASLLRESGDWEELIRLILSQAPSLASQGRFGTLEEWIRALPQNTLEEIPWLRYWMGVCRMAFQPGESMLHFERAYRAFRECKDAPGTFLSWSGIVESIVFGLQEFKAMDRMIAELNDVMEETGSFPSREIEERICCSMMKAIAFSHEGTNGCDKELWVERALSVARTSADNSVRAEALISLLFHHLGSDFQKTGVALDMLRELARRPGAPTIVRVQLCWASAFHALMTGNYELSMKSVTEGLDIADAAGVHVMDFVLMGNGILHFMINGDFAAAKDFLRRMAASSVMATPYDQAFYHHLAAWMALGEGDLAKSRLHSEQSLRLADDVGEYWAIHLVYLQKAFLCFESGAEEEAFSALASSRRAISGGGRGEFSKFVCPLTEAFFLLRKGEEKKALAPLRVGMQAGREKGFGGVYLACPGFLELVTAKALEAGIEPEYVRELIRKNRLVPGDAQLGLEQWPWPVKIRTLGGFEILRDGKPLSFSRKVQQKPLAMLKVFLALGGKEVPEEKITDALWPEAEGDLSHQSFATTLRRLRVLLGDERAILLRDGRISLDDRYCWTDVRALDRFISEADREKESPKHDVARHREMISRVLDIYRGPFLSGEGDHPAVVAFRERLRGRFLRCVADCGKHLEEAGEWDAAVSCYRKGLEVDDLAEEFYRGLMECYGRLGRNAEAVSVYRRCRKALSSHLGVDPSRGTEAIYRSLFAGTE
jgi:DNA-binding SARP family transcriptional activator